MSSSSTTNTVGFSSPVFRRRFKSPQNAKPNAAPTKMPPNSLERELLAGVREGERACDHHGDGALETHRAG